MAISGEGEELITACLDYSQVRKARQLLPTVRDSNISAVQREMNRLIEKLGIPDIVRE